jgi:hypothetical protein
MSGMLVDSKDVPDMAAGLGNPMLYEVNKSDDETKQLIKTWLEKMEPDKIPKDARHLVLLIATSVPWKISCSSTTLLR